jgi:plasmid stabilization system protein ParE
MRVRYTPRASRNIETIYQYLQKRSPSGATKVIASIRATVDYIAEQPLGSEATDHPDIRMKLVTDYRYKIFYRIRGDAIEIVHIRHASRRPW